MRAMRSIVKPSGRSLSMMFFIASWASIFEIGTPRRVEIATRRTSEPSSSRTLLLILLAIKIAMSSGKIDAVEVRLAFQDRDLGLEIGRLDIGDQSPLETRMQPLLQRRYLARRAIARDDDLLLIVMQRIEGMEKLFLRALLAGHELTSSISSTSIERYFSRNALRLVVADRVDQLVHELFGRDIRNTQMPVALFDRVADRMHQMRFAEADAAVDK